MLGKRKTPATPRVRFEDLPLLPLMHTPEQLAAFRQAVAALPARVEVPPLPEHPTDEDHVRRARWIAVDTEQRMQADAARLATDPREAAQRRDLARMRLAQLDRAARELQAQRVVVVAELAAAEEVLS